MNYHESFEKNTDHTWSLFERNGFNDGYGEKGYHPPQLILRWKEDYDQGFENGAYTRLDECYPGISEATSQMHIEGRSSQEDVINWLFLPLSKKLQWDTGPYLEEYDLPNNTGLTTYIQKEEKPEMKRVTFTNLSAYLFIPDDIERNNGDDYLIEIPIPEGPEITHRGDAMLITTRARHIETALRNVKESLMWMGYRGELDIVGMDDTPIYGTIDFSPEEATMESFDYVRLVKQYEENAQIKRAQRIKKKLADGRGGCCQ